MNKPITIYADFNNADSKGRIRLNTEGSKQEIVAKGVDLQSGLKVMLDDDEGLSVLGTVQFSTEEKIWVVEINWDEIVDRNKKF
jgi:hypothetical protein